jgi:hypothetical protein
VPLSVGGLPAGAVTPLVAEGVLEVSDGLTFGDGDWLGEVAGFFVPVAEAVAVARAEDAGVVVQSVAVPVAFACALGEPVAVALPVGVALTVAVAVTVGVTLGVIVGLGLSVGLAAGLVVVGLASGLVVVAGGDGLAFGEASGDVLGVVLEAGDVVHGVPGDRVSLADVPLPRAPAPVPESPECDPDAVALDEEVAPLKAEVAALITLWRNTGTAASMTPRANTVTPMARAGRSMTSLKFLGRRGACRARAAEPGPAGAEDRPDPAWRQYPPSWASNPAITSRMAAILGWLA